MVPDKVNLEPQRLQGNSSHLASAETNDSPASCNLQTLHGFSIPFCASSGPRSTAPFSTRRSQWETRRFFSSNGFPWEVGFHGVPWGSMGFQIK